MNKPREADTMRFIFLIYQDNDPPQSAEGVFHAEARRAGGYVSGGALQPAFTATTVRVRYGKIGLSDSPAVETAPGLSGYCVLDFPDERDAVQWAARIPAARTGAVEIRRVFRTRA